MTDSFAQFGIHLPSFSAEFLSEMSDVFPLLVTAIPLGIYNFTEGMNNVESASAAGDNYNLRYILLADGIGAVVGSFLGSPFPPAVYIGHPGWKAVGGRIGYSLATGIVIGLICLLGLVGLFLAVIPIQALVPILLFIGLVIGAQAFQTTPGPACAGDRPGAAAEHRVVGPGPDRQLARRPRARTPPTVGFDAARRQRRGLRRDGDPRRGRGPVGPAPRRDRGLRHRQAVQPRDRVHARSPPSCRRSA